MNGGMKSPTAVGDGLEMRGMLDGSYLGIANCNARDTVPFNCDHIPAANPKNQIWSQKGNIEIDIVQNL